MSDELHAEDGFGCGFGIGKRLGDLHAAALATAAGVNLRLDDDGGVAGGEERLGGGIGLLKRGGHFAAGDGHVVLAQDLFGLVLVNLHDGVSPVNAARPMLANEGTQSNVCGL